MDFHLFGFAAFVVVALADVDINPSPFLVFVALCCEWRAADVPGIWMAFQSCKSQRL